MSFLSILKTIGKDALLGAKVAEPVIASMNPLAGAITNGVISAVSIAENTIQGSKQGELKKQLASEIVLAILPIGESLYHQTTGNTINIDNAEVGNAIDECVALLNSIEKLYSSFSITKGVPVI